MSCKAKICRVKRLSEELGSSAFNLEKKYEYLVDLVKNKWVEKLIFVLPYNQKIETRVTYHHRIGALCEYIPRSRKYVRPLSADLIKNSLDVEWEETRSEMVSERDRTRHSTLEMLSIVEKIANAIKKYKHPNLDIGWEWLTELDYEQLAEQITANVLEQYDQHLQRTGGQKIQSWEENYFHIQDAFLQALQFQLGEKKRLSALPFKYKLITLTSYPPESYRGNKPAFIEQYIQKIKTSLDNKEPIVLQWRSTYDITVSTGQTNAGVFRGNVALEYKGLGNGHYYVLLDENHALWVEDD